MISSEPEDYENDMLDMAFGLTDTSRLGCQVKLTRELDGLTAPLPSATRNTVLIQSIRRSRVTGGLKSTKF